MTVRHSEPSLLMSLDDEPYQPSSRLLDLVVKITERVIRMMRNPIAAHPMLSARDGAGPRWYEHPTGDHYHLLRAVCEVLEPKIIWEFGTGTGMSTVAMMCGGGWEIHTVDTIDYSTWINRQSDPIQVHIGDMCDTLLHEAYCGNLYHTDLIFVDGPKDGVTEAKFCELLDTLPFARPPIVIFDDIRLMNMVHVWRAIRHPKMDVTSLGHWSGTGMVEWS